VIRTGVKFAGVGPFDRRGRARWTTRPVSDVAELFSPDSDDQQRLRASLYNDPTGAAAGREDAEAILRSAIADMSGASDERMLILLDKRFTTAEQIVSWSTRWTRAHGLSLQLPYLDHDLVAVAMQMSGPRTGKDLLRSMAADWMPHDMAYAPKIPQQMPIGTWLHGPLAERATARLRSLPASMARVFDQPAVNHVVDDHTAGRVDHGWLVIALLTTAMWFEQLDAMAASSRSPTVQ
jgi:asparagine synthase (glutamine-hydrolysing)